jgi:hypothetical protein
MDWEKGLHGGFTDELWRLLSGQQGTALQAELDHLPGEAAEELGRQGARAALAPLIWSSAVGDRWDVRRVTEFLRISRQAVYKRVRSGSLLGIPGQGTTWFPAWQFDTDRHIVRPVVAAILQQFRDADPGIDPLVIAAWATEPNRLLDRASPADWIRAGHADDRVMVAARRVAQGLAA